MSAEPTPPSPRPPSPPMHPDHVQGLSYYHADVDPFATPSHSDDEDMEEKADAVADDPVAVAEVADKDAGGSSPLLFVAFKEHNYKEHECWLRFLQWTGNEKALRRLAVLCDRSHSTSVRGDQSKFYIDIEHLLPQAAVEAVSAVDVPGYTHALATCYGPFRLPQDLWKGNVEAFEALDNHFFADQIGDYFSWVMAPEPPEYN